jgi:L,D-transpeptidase ErfK/SrfK
MSVTRAAGVLLVSVVLASCSLLNGKWAAEKKPEPPPEPVVPVIPPPVPTSKFVIAPEQDLVGVVQVTTSTKEDTLSDIARRFNVGYEEIVRANPGVDPWLPGDGKQIVVPSQFIIPDGPREGIVINVPQMRIFYFPPAKKGEPQYVYTHPIGIGRVGWATPQGTTKVVRRQKDPTWRPTASILKEHRENGEELERVIGPGPDNPLGRYAFYLGWPSYMIHGTNKPAGVGLRSSHGCIRLYPEDIKELFEMAPVGTKVRVVNEPFVFGWQNDTLYLQALNVLEDDPRDWKKAQKKLVSKSLGADIQKELKKRKEEVNWDLVSTIAHAPRGIPLPISGSGGVDVDQLIASAPHVQNTVPEGASWDGKSDLPVDEATFREMLSDRDPQEPASGGTANTGSTASPAAGSASTAPPKTGT